MNGKALDALRESARHYREGLEQHLRGEEQLERRRQLASLVAHAIDHDSLGRETVADILRPGRPVSAERVRQLLELGRRIRRAARARAESHIE